MGKQTKDLERQKSRDVVNELSTVFTTSTRTATQRPQQQPQQQTQIVTGAPIRGPQPDEFIVSEELPEALAKLEAAQKARHQSGVNVDVEESKEKIIKPSFKKKPDDLEAREGRLVRFDCVVAGNPRPELSWFHNGYQIFDSSRCKILVNETGIHSLLFMQVSQHDTGTVSCIARNKGGEASFSVQLTVLERETIERPRFIERLPATLTIKAGSEILLSTTAEGVPTPMLSWQKDGVALSDGQGCRINTNGGHTQLIVEAASESSSGWYQCTAVNVGGTAATRGKVLIDGGETSAAAVQRRQAERFEEVEERSERLDAIDALEAKRRKVEAEQLRYKDFDDGSDSSRLSAIQLLELRREQANRKVERNTKERETPSAITALEIQLQHIENERRKIMDSADDANINIDAIASLEARRHQIEARYHDVYQLEDDRPQSSAISDLEFRLLAMEEERKLLVDNVNMDDKERLKSISQLELRLAALEEERRKLREAHFDTGDRHGAVANLEARLQQIDAERAKLKEPHFDNRDRLVAYEALECQLQALEAQQKALKNIDYGSSANTEAINNLEKRLNMAEEERKKLHDAPEPEMDRIRRAIKRVEARRSIIEEQLHAVNTLPDEHRARSGAIAELELRLNEIEEDRKRLYEAPELSTQQEAIQNLEKHLKALEEQRQMLLEVEDKSINLDAIEELEKQLKNVEEERKLAKEGPVEALESERKKAINELDGKLAKLEEERRILKEIPDHLSPHHLAITKLEKDLAKNKAAQLKLKEGPDYG